MNFVAKVLNVAALSSAKNSTKSCSVFVLDEPKMPASMVK